MTQKTMLRFDYDAIEGETIIAVVGCTDGV